MRSRAALVLASGVWGCGAGLPPATAVDAARAGVSVAELDAARTRYVDKCSGCHALHAPSDLRASEWPAAVDEMATEQVELTAADRALILRYLTTFAAPGG